MFEERINEQFSAGTEKAKSFDEQRLQLLKYIETAREREAELGGAIKNECLAEHRQIIKERLEGKV